MSLSHVLAVAVLFFIVAGEKADNPWRAKLAAALEAAREQQSVVAYRSALETAWRADDWQAGLELATAAIEKHPDAAELVGPATRALWRAGHLDHAARLANRLSADSQERVDLSVLTTISLARGDIDRALATAERLAALDELSAADLLHVLMARATANRFDGLGKLIRMAQERVDPANGYPEIHLADQIKGLAEFFDAIGPAPVNRLTAGGSAAMPVIPLVNLPGCDVMINGRGPYRMIVDTGGSITLSIDSAVAEELGLETISVATIHGVAGKDQSGQSLIDELRIGGITCRRVLARTFDVRKAVAFAADGIIGTGIFADGRMALDFETGRLTVTPASDKPGPGQEVPLWLIGDAKMITTFRLAGEPVAALLDSGADVFAVSTSRLKTLFPDKPIRSLPVVGALGVGADQAPEVSITPGIDFVFAGREFENYGGLGLDVLDTLLGPMLGVQSDLLIGMAIMRQFKTMTVDFKHCRMWVEWLDRH
jgi:hypothetical protein